MLTDKQREALSRFGNGDVGEFCTVGDEQDLGMDNHGCQVNLVAFKKAGDPKLYGFIYRESSEEAFYEDDREVFELEAFEVTETRYRRADGAEWDVL